MEILSPVYSSAASSFCITDNLSLPSPSAFSFARVTASCLGGFLSVPLTSRLLKLPTLVSVAATLEALPGGSLAQLSAVSVLQMETCVWCECGFALSQGLLGIVSVRPAFPWSLEVHSSCGLFLPLYTL